MDTDDLEPRAKPVGRPDFEIMSIEQLNEHIAGLEAEIELARAAIAKKDKARNAADAFFKS